MRYKKSFLLSSRSRSEALAKIPKNIESLIFGKSYTQETIGRSGSTILMFDDAVLKIMSFNPRNDKAVAMLQWLSGKLSVPEVIYYDCDSNRQYLLMSRIFGKMSCDPYYLRCPEILFKCLAEAFDMLWSVDISDCPCDRSLDIQLSEAKSRIENGLVLEGVDKRFPSAAALLTWLENNKPDSDPVFSHGDFCLPNILLKDEHVSGFVDLDTAGVADRYQDIALCYKSLIRNTDGSFGGIIYSDVKSDGLFDELGIDLDRDRLEYYLLLDELF